MKAVDMTFSADDLIGKLPTLLTCIAIMMRLHMIINLMNYV